MKLYEDLESMGIDKERLRKALDANDNWGKMAYAFEFLTVCGTVLANWPTDDS
jgi:hypothetical protein